MVALLVISVIWILGILLLFGLQYFFSGIWENPKVDWMKTLIWPIYIGYRIVSPYFKKRRKSK